MYGTHETKNTVRAIGSSVHVVIQLCFDNKTVVFVCGQQSQKKFSHPKQEPTRLLRHLSHRRRSRSGPHTCNVMVVLER